MTAALTPTGPRTHDGEIIRPRTSGTCPRLTARENEVLRWIARGLKDHEIGQRLGLSRKTIRRHLERAQSVLGTAGRVETALTWLLNCKGPKCPIGG